MSIDWLIRLIVIVVLLYCVWIGGLWLLVEIGAAAILFTIFKIVFALVAFLVISKEVGSLF